MIGETHLEYHKVKLRVNKRIQASRIYLYAQKLVDLLHNAST